MYTLHALAIVHSLYGEERTKEIAATTTKYITISLT
jgi:hypothetical protein